MRQINNSSGEKECSLRCFIPMISNYGCFLKNKYENSIGYVSVNKNLKTNYRKDSSKVLGSGIIL
jgi:hypothetical protein